MALLRANYRLQLLLGSFKRAEQRGDVAYLSGHKPRELFDDFDGLFGDRARHGRRQFDVTQLDLRVLTDQVP